MEKNMGVVDVIKEADKEEAVKKEEKKESLEEKKPEEMKESGEEKSVEEKKPEKQKPEEKIESGEEKSKEGKNPEEKKPEGKESGEEKTKEDKKPEEKKKSGDEKSKEDKKPEEKKPEEKKSGSNKAVTQSKRIAEAQEAAKKAQEQQEDAPDKGKGHKGAAVVIGCLAGILLIAYVAGFAYFSGHYYRDVTINGINVSGLNQTKAKSLLEQFYADYSLDLKTIDDKDVVIDGKDISIQIVLHDDFGKCLKEQEPYIWFVNYFKHHEYQVSADVVWDEEQLEDIYDNMTILDTKCMTAPKDAYVGVKDGKFTIIEEVPGTTIQVKKFKQVVEAGLKEVQSTVDLQENGCYQLPKVYATDDALKNELEALGKYADCNIKLQLDDLTLEPGMELYENVLEKKDDTYELSDSMVKKYVHKLAEKYDSLGTDRTFTTSFDGKKVKVHGDAFGYEINQEETVKALIKALEAGKSTTVDVVFDEKGISLQGDNDIGNTYIEVNLSEQRVIAYKDGKKIAEGDCVSGKESAGNGTCIGLYKIQDKLSPTVLRGEKKPVTKTEVKKNKKGKKVKKTTTTYEYEYESPVTYWLQFNGGIGLHDAAGWRSQYGGSIYYYSGSHGCVNLPLDLAKTLYENFEVGDPVVVYFWDNENRK